MIGALNKKMIRDLIRIRGQALAICAVIAAGIATLVMALSAMDSLHESRDTFYERYGFADVFARMKRAPATLLRQIEALPGVAQVDERVVFEVTIDVAGMDEPATGRLISLPDIGKPRLNGLFLRRGRWLAPWQRNEVLVGEAFALAHGLVPGDHVVAIINGRRQKLKIVGIALSPEYLIQIGAGSLLPDDRRFGVFYMSYQGLAAALDMEGAFNDVSLTLMRGASEQDVLDRLDDLTRPYGGVGAYGREDQVSNAYISDEIRQLKGMAMTAPIIFLGVAAFLLNVVVSRLVNTQREQIASLKAFGYSRFEIGRHYIKMVCLIPIVGTVVGSLFGLWMGHSMTVMYAKFYKFPEFTFRVDPTVLLLALLVSSVAALVGTLAAVRRAVRLAPAEAMRPEPPPNYRPTILERTGLGRLLPQTARMILRNLERRPVKALLSILGMSMAVAVLIVGSFGLDAINYIMDFQFRLSQRQDVNVTYFETTSHHAVHELEHLPGVMQVQPFRSVPVRMRFGHRHERTSVMGLEDSGLYRLMDDEERETVLPNRGLMLSSKLADKLQIKPGELATVEILEGDRDIRDLPVSGLINEFGGLNAYMHIDQVRRLMGEGSTSNGAFLQVDSADQTELFRTLKATPRVAGVGIKGAMMQSFEENVAENLLQMRFFNIIFATVIAFGVVYNSARISLAERSRELSTLRVIGFTRGEISGIMLGELGVLSAVAIPLGMVIGYGLAGLLTLTLDTDFYRIPLVIESSTFAYAGIVVLIATIISGLIVRRHIDHLDLIAVLKSKE
ncbi:MAG: ABC transporter permease [Pirellulaceae bacterium]